MSVLNYENITYFIIKNPITATALQRRNVHDSAESQRARALSEHWLSNAHMDLLHSQFPEWAL